MIFFYFLYSVFQMPYILRDNIYSNI